MASVSPEITGLLVCIIDGIRDNPVAHRIKGLYFFYLIQLECPVIEFLEVSLLLFRHFDGAPKAEIFAQECLHLVPRRGYTVGKRPSVLSYSCKNPELLVDLTFTPLADSKTLGMHNVIVSQFEASGLMVGSYENKCLIRMLVIECENYVDGIGKIVEFLDIANGQHRLSHRLQP